MEQKILSIKELVGEMLGEGYEVIHKVSEKTNGIMKNYLMITNSESNMAPNIPLEKLLKSEDIEYIAEKVVEIYRHETENGELDVVDMKNYINKEYIAKNAITRLVNKARVDAVAGRYMDMELEYVLSIEVNGIDGTILITKQIAEYIGMTEEDIVEAAKKNDKRKQYKAIDIGYLMSRIVGIKNGEEENLLEKDSLKGYQMIVITNPDRSYAADAMMNTETLDKLRNLFDSDLYILPSSIHEIIVLPKEDSFTEEDLKNMVREVNDTQVPPEEVLSYSVYKYDKDGLKIA